MLSYKKWIINLIYFNFVSFGLFLSFLTYLHYAYNYSSLEGKEYLLDYNPKLIFAGDSRAELQLDPKIASEVLHINMNDVVNIAAPGGDPVMLEYLIKQHPEKFINSTVILSMSAYHLNDAVTEHGYFGYTTISKMNLLQQLDTFTFDNFMTLKYYYEYAFNRKFRPNKVTNINVQTNGFSPTSKVFSPVKKYHVTEHVKNIAWYTLHDNFYGYRYHINVEALHYIKSHVKKIYIYTGFFAPSYVKISKNIHHFTSEQKFQIALQKMCSDLNIELIVNDKHSILKDEDFSDEVHLNQYGAKKFTKLILQEINSTSSSNKIK